MHIPDGFLSTGVNAASWAAAAGTLACCFHKARRQVQERTIPLLGVIAAFVFAAQLVNFPILAGTSGHLLGAALAGILLGPWLGAIALASVLIFQCLLFQDGGLLALGANIVNMSAAGTFGGYVVYFSLQKIIGGKKGLIIGTAAASWCSVLLAAVLCALELALSGTSPLRLLLPAMAAIYSLIGIVEALITIAIIGFIQKTRPDLIHGRLSVPEPDPET